jgi:cytochrome bd-type quinol oxidase subunit 2
LPFVVPYALTYEQAASSPSALALMLIGVAILLPFILAISTILKKTKKLPFNKTWL